MPKQAKSVVFRKRNQHSSCHKNHVKRYIHSQARKTDQDHDEPHDGDCLGEREIHDARAEEMQIQL